MVSHASKTHESCYQAEVSQLWGPKRVYINLQVIDLKDK